MSFWLCLWDFLKEVVLGELVEASSQGEIVCLDGKVVEYPNILISFFYFYSRLKQRVPFWLVLCF